MQKSWPPSCSHGTYQHKAITSRSRQLLMMGTWLPETCWATIRREIKNTKKATSSWFFLSTQNYDVRSTTHQIDKCCWMKTINEIAFSWNRQLSQGLFISSFLVPQMLSTRSALSIFVGTIWGKKIVYEGPHYVINSTLFYRKKPTRCTNISNLFYFGIIFYILRLLDIASSW